MSLRRPTLSIALLTMAILPSACRMLRPVNPNDTKKPAAEKPAPARNAGKPTAAKGAPAPAPSTSMRELRAGLTDPSIAAMVLALNNTDISYARLAPSRGERADVKAFAQRMLTDHTGINGSVNDLLAKLNLLPVDNTASLDMRDESASRRDAMRDLTGYSFDSTYIDNEVAYHVKYLATLDSVLIPVAKNAELKGLLVSARPAVAAHLAHAEQVRANVLSRQ